MVMASGIKEHRAGEVGIVSKTYILFSFVVKCGRQIIAVTISDFGQQL